MGLQILMCLESFVKFFGCARPSVLVSLVAYGQYCVVRLGSDANLCSKCGAANTFKFCKSCGTRRTEPAKTAVATPTRRVSRGPPLAPGQKFNVRTSPTVSSRAPKAPAPSRPSHFSRTPVNSRTPTNPAAASSPKVRLPLLLL